jgi:predicted amidohydrolase
LIQSHLHWEDKGANLAFFEQKIVNLEAPTEIVILPEMFNTGFSMQPELHAETMEGPSVEWMRRIAMSQKVILTGLFGCYLMANVVIMIKGIFLHLLEKINIIQQATKD